MGIDELRDRYDELDNIISSIRILTKEIKDKDYGNDAMELFGFDRKMSEEEIVDWLMNKNNQ